NDRVVAFDRFGRSRVVLGRSAGGAGALSGPVGISVSANGDIHVADTDNNRIVVIAPDGLVVSMWPAVSQEPTADPVTKPGWFAGPEGICITRDGRTFVTDTANHRVQVLQ
ncbi:MAG: 6-bladed beta-propeller, partial [Actinobacteria bacterium]|nr:6-bladed beta-propeller [Actinomycetota bacterium]